jgi:hypothetical protein
MTITAQISRHLGGTRSYLDLCMATSGPAFLNVFQQPEPVHRSAELMFISCIQHAETYYFRAVSNFCRHRMSRSIKVGYMIPDLYVGHADVIPGAIRRMKYLSVSALRTAFIQPLPCIERCAVARIRTLIANSLLATAKPLTIATTATRSYMKFPGQLMDGQATVYCVGAGRRRPTITVIRQP